MKRYWLKLPHDILSMPRIAMLQDRLWRRFIELLLVASKTNKAGELPSVKEISWLLRHDIEQVETELAELAEVGALSIVEGVYSVAGYEDMQAASKHAQYMREWRDKKKAGETQEKRALTR